MFSDRLTVSLALVFPGHQHDVPGSAVKLLQLDLHGYGFEGALEFVVIDDADQGGQEEDTLLADFVKDDPIEVRLSIRTQFPDPETQRSIEPVGLTALVTARSVEEISDRTQDRTITWRRYRIEIADPARVLWSQHFPCALFTKKSMKDAILAQATSRIPLTFDGEELEKQVPLIFLHLQPDDEASFYDFLAHYLDRHAGVLTYDYAGRSYKIAAARDAAGTPEELFGDDVASLRVVFPELPRHARNVVNTFAPSAATKAVTTDLALDPIRQDYLVRLPIAQRLDDRTALEKRRLVVPKSELAVSFRRWPTVTFVPGALLKFYHADLWPSDALQIAASWRVFHHRIEARARDPQPEVDRGLPSTSFEIEVSARLEQAEETRARLPPYVVPTYPGYVEGTVVSEKGADDELTYQFYTDQDTSLDEYEVKVPAFADQIVTAPYDPHQGSGKMYLPLHKGARVLLELEPFHATVCRLLDWRPGVRLSQDAQGEQIFWGKKATAGTLVSHAYDDDKPVYKIARAHEKDKATIEIKEGVLTIQIKEDA